MELLELGGTLIPDGPAMVTIVKSFGGYLGSKVGGAIGKKFDKKKPVKEDLTQIDELINPNINLPFGGDRITHNHGGAGRSWWRLPLVSSVAAMVCQQKEEERRRRRKEKQEEEKKCKSKTTNESITTSFRNKPSNFWLCWWFNAWS